MDASQVLDPRKTIFVGGVPRPLRAVELALIMDRLYGGVCYAGIDVDPELKYPKGTYSGWKRAGRWLKGCGNNYEGEGDERGQTETLPTKNIWEENLPKFCR